MSADRPVSSSSATSETSVTVSESKFKISITTAGLVAGSLGGLAGVITGHPFDTVKVRLQSQNQTAPIYRGTLHCAKTIIQKESVFGLFKGMGTPLVSVALINSALFGVYEGLVELQTGDSSKYPSLEQIFFAGLGSGLVNSLISSPMELVKIQLQNQGADMRTTPYSSSASGAFSLYQNRNFSTLKPASVKQFKGPLDCIAKIYKNAGLRGLYRGLPVTVLREGPSYAAYFVSYEVFCRLLAPENTSTRELSGWRLMLCAGMAGICGWCSTYPIDVAKTIIQADLNILDKLSKPIRVRDCLELLYRQNGIPALFRGLNATIIRAFPTNVAVLSTWQLTMNYFRLSGIIEEGSLYGSNTV